MLAGPVVAEARGADLNAAEERAAPEPWYVPDHVKLQLAGQIGFLSPGLGVDLASGKLHLDLFLGWVPESVGGKDILSVTGKLGYAPWRLRVAPRWHVVPLTAAVQATYTFGSQYFVEAPEHYPSGYYEMPTALDLGVSLGGAVLRQQRGSDREVGVYYEIVALGKMLMLWRENPDVLDASDVLSMALGAMLRF